MSGDVGGQRGPEAAPPLSLDEFARWRSPRLVTGNPTCVSNPVWCWLVRTRLSAYHANEKLRGASSFNAGPMWCFDRSGQTETKLPDGRVVHIGGEHEDFYDPDFYIYNDVTTVDVHGDVEVYGYPTNVFPPTDFHTATLVGGSIIVIGCLGYVEQRVSGTTPVFRLALDSLRIERFHTCGEGPGWIFGHSALLSDDASAIIVSGGKIWRGEGHASTENFESWSLELSTGAWARLACR